MIARVFLIAVMGLHGLIHLMGFVKAFQLAEMEALTLPVSRPAGVIWLVVAVLFLAAAGLYGARISWWWMIAAVAVVASQILIAMAWKDAKFGTIANAIVLVPVVVGCGVWLFQRAGQEQLDLLQQAVAKARASATITERDLNGLPPIVQTWLRRSHVIGQPKAATVMLRQEGEMRTTKDGRWMPFQAKQWILGHEPAFLWQVDVAAAPGLHLAGRDTYRQGKGRMLIKLLSLIAVADADGPSLDQGAMVRYLSEIIWLPTGALQPHISWKSKDKTSAIASITFGGKTAEGTFRFSEEGDFVGFQARRYYQRGDTSSLEDWRVEVIPGQYRAFRSAAGDVRVPVKAKVVWKLKGGDFEWFRVTINDLVWEPPPRLWTVQ